MSVWWTLAWHSAWNRRFVLSLTALAVALSTFVLLSIARIRTDVQDSFSQAVSGTDLIVGARTSPIELLMYSVFRMGGVSRNIKESSLETIRAHRAVDWVVPLSLGDSHKGHPVVATSPDYFDHFRYGDHRPLEMAQGRRFEQENEAVLGADVAARLGYRLGDKLVLAHGDGALEESDHADHPIVVSGILKPTGTPVDRSIHIGLEAMDDMHGGPLGAMLGIPSGLPGLTSPPPAALMPGESGGMPEHMGHRHANRQVTAALVGLKNRAAVFSVQREVNNFRGEPMMAILPGVVLDELWRVVNSGERALWLVSGLVAVVSLLGLMATILASLDARRRELAILRALGAGPARIGFLLALEGMLVSVIGICVGVAASLLGNHFAAGAVRRLTGVNLHTGWLTAEQWPLIGAVLACAMLVCLVPGWRAFRLALQDGLTPRT
jgi:putative ABC transport system permease protein